MIKPGYVNIYVAGDALLLVPMAGWGGGYKEQDEQDRLDAADPGLEAALDRMLAFSDLRPGGFDRPSVPYSKTAYARAGAMARRKGAKLRCFRLLRDETGLFTLQLLCPIVGERGLGPETSEEHPRDIAEAAYRIRTMVEAKRPV